MDALLENRDQPYDNIIAVNLAIKLSSKQNQKLFGNSTHTTQETSNVPTLVGIMSNCVKNRIDPTISGIHIHKAHYWGGFVNMIDTDALIHHTMLTLQPFKEISEVFYRLENDDVDFFILLDNEEYDSTLMRKLIKNERLISKMWQGRNLDFHYAPIKQIDKLFIIKGYKIAFKKG